MPAVVGNEAARDSLKHTLAYIIRAAITEIVPTAGPIISIHYDKRGAKIAVQYKGDDCSDAKEKVEESANLICEKNADLNQIKLNGEDSEGLKSFDTLKTAGDAGGATIKKFTVNAGKEQLILEFNVGAPKKKEPETEVKGASNTKSKTATGNSKKSAKASTFAYDSVSQVSDQLIEELLLVLKEEGVSVQGKEESLRSKFSDRLLTPLTLLKNTAYTRGFKSHISEPVSNFIVKR